MIHCLHHLSGELVKILLVGNYFYPEHTGGVETVSYNLVKHYRRVGHKVRWVAADVPPRFRSVGDDDVPIRAWNITEERLGFPQPIPYAEVFLKLYNNIRWCDVIHLQDCLYLINILTFFIAKLFHKPILITQYAKFIPYSQYYKRVLQFIAYHTVGWLMFTTADKVVFITANVRDNMQYISPRKMREIVPLGVDTDFYSPLSNEDRNRIREALTGSQTMPLILFVGRMVERKGVHLIRPLVQLYPKWYWVFVGRPDDFNPAEWGMPNLTYFQYATEQQLKELYSSADLLVHPSVGEGITLTVRESMACGLPVLISHESLYNVSGKERACFVSVQPETKEIEKALVTFFADAQSRNEMRKKARSFIVSRSSWDVVARKYLVHLERLHTTKVGVIE